MEDCVNMQSRIERFNNIFTEKKALTNIDLLTILPISTESKNRIIESATYFIWDCLINNNPDKNYNQLNNILENYSEDILNLPNITPNGLILPKKENILSFNKFQNVVFNEFEKLNINNKIARIQFPINLRLQNGALNNSDRPRSSSKRHVDMWAGDPSAGILVFLNVLGDFKNIGINFFMPEKFPKELIKPLQDFNLGKVITDNARKLNINLNDDGWFFVDPFVVHETFKNSNKIRISLDFRFIPQEIADADNFEDKLRKPYFINTQKYKELGVNTLIMAEQSMHEKFTYKKYTTTYPVRIKAIRISDQNQKISQEYLEEKFDLNKGEFQEIFPNDFRELEYQVLKEKDRDNIILSIMNKLNSDNLRIVGKDDNTVWEKGWGEILQSTMENFHPTKLAPQYFNHHNIMRFDGHYIKGITSNFAYQLDHIIRRICLFKHVGKAKKIVELGCGTGSGMVLIANHTNIDTKLIASDWTDASSELIKRVGQHCKRDIKFVKFNMLNPENWQELDIDKDTVVISSHALEQLGTGYEPLLNMLHKTQARCVHLEPIIELYDENNLFDQLASAYHKKRNYLGNYLTDIKNLTKLNKAKILKCQRLYFGGMDHEAYTLLVWRGTSA